MTHNQIDYWNYVESKRHNEVSEGETYRHNVYTENETHRHNVISESTEINKLNESVRHNQAVEAETARHNRAQESVEWSKALETQRHDTATESLTNYANETARRAQEATAALQGTQMDLNRTTEQQAKLTGSVTRKNLSAQAYEHNTSAYYKEKQIERYDQLIDAQVYSIYLGGTSQAFNAILNGTNKVMETTH